MKIGNSLINFFSYLLSKKDPETQTTAAEQKLIKKYCSGKLKAVEIGVFQGFNTCYIASLLDSKGIVFGIDPFFTGKIGISYNRLITNIFIKRKNLSTKIALIEKLSSSAVSDIPDNIDFIFIDGDHTYDGVKQDFEMYSQKLSTEGVMAFHDARIFKNGWTKQDWGPVRLVNEIIQTSGLWSVIDEADSLVVIKRKQENI